MGGQASKEWVYSPVEAGDGALLLHSLDRDTADSSEDEELYSADDNPGAELEPGEEAGWWATLLQILFPFLLAGLGMVAAGLVLDIVQHWVVFEKIPELFILVPALLGLKGNLEMTLASRLSTAANLGRLDGRSACLSLVAANLVLVQLQAIVVGLLAAVTGLLLGWAMTAKLEAEHGLLLCASSVVTASLASLALGLVMVIVILASRACSVDPDNVATPIAASLGDLTTLGLLAWIASLLWRDLDLQHDAVLAPAIICSYLVLAPVLAWLAWRHPATRPVLLHGWTPVLFAMLISSAGGLILDNAVVQFSGIAVYQPVMNGVGGNLAAVQASRMSTALHNGRVPPGGQASCISPWAALCRGDMHAQTATILLLLTIPGHLLFTLAISYLEAGHTAPTPPFIIAYILAALTQVLLLLYLCRLLVYWLWSRGSDPDNCAIPYLTALGDLLGGAFLAAAFLLLHTAGLVLPANIEKLETAVNSSVSSLLNTATTQLTSL